MCYQSIKIKNKYNNIHILGSIQPINLFNFNIQKNKQRYYHISNIRSKNRIGPQNFDVISVIIGSLLGDASSFLNKNFSTSVKVPLNLNPN
jgi:hypothetical protein